MASKSPDIEKVSQFLNEYQFTYENELDDVFRFGNNKSTSLKMRFVFSELFLNVLKNTSDLQRSRDAI